MQQISFNEKHLSLSFLFQKKGNEPKKHFVQKKKVSCDKKFDNFNNTFKLKEECEQTLVTVSSNSSCNDMTAYHFCKAEAPLLKAFKNVMKTNDLSTLKETDVLKKCVVLEQMRSY